MHSHPTELTGPAHARVHAPQANAHCWHRHARTRCMRASLCCALLHTHHLYALPNNRGREDIRPGVYSHAEWNQRADTRFSALRMARSGVGMRCLGVLYSRTKSPSPNMHTRNNTPSVPLCVRAHTPDRDAHGTTPTVCDITWISSRFGKRAGKWAAAQGARGLLCGSCGLVADLVVCMYDVWQNPAWRRTHCNMLQCIVMCCA
jgi:hypothetical protein